MKNVLSEALSPASKSRRRIGMTEPLIVHVKSSLIFHDLGGTMADRYVGTDTTARYKTATGCMAIIELLWGDADQER
jgi:hypothetical protein